MTLELTSTRRTPRPAPEEGDRPDTVGKVVTALIVGVPFLALIAGVIVFWGNGIHLRDVILAVVLYALIGHGMAIGYHRLLAHKSFVARRPVKLVVVALASMAYEGGPIGWVATHRRHHVFADEPGDPHTPHHHGPGLRGQLRGLWHAHVGWLFTSGSTSAQRHAADLLIDRDMVVMDRLFPFWCVVSLAIPFGAGWLVGGSFAAALGALFWAGLVRVCVLHHATWSINSLCHTFGRRPFRTKDLSSNVRALALVSMGESWHNGHHAFPRSARHGLLPHQVDTSAMVIRVLERLSLVTRVHWPTAAEIDARRLPLVSRAQR